MRNKSILILCLTLFLFLGGINLNAQKGLKNTSNTLFINGNNSDPFLISTQPVTNRQYLTYLAWLWSIYVDYPEMVLDAIPGLVESSTYPDYYDNWKIKDLRKYIDHTETMVKNYMFNPTYIDYPVVGLTKSQAQDYCKWASDRYNEYSLVKRKLMPFNVIQLNEDCFITEAYLEKEYTGYVSKSSLTWYGEDEANASWDDHVVIPCFRLPTSSEIEESLPVQPFSLELKAYPMKSSDYLCFWTKSYLKVSNDYYVFSTGPRPNFIDTIYATKSILDLTSAKVTEHCLNNSSPGRDVIDAYLNMDQDTVNMDLFSMLETDSLGRMRYIIIGENEKQRPVCVELKTRYMKKGSISMDRLNIFRFACKIRPKQFKL